MMHSRPLRTIAELGKGDHACCLYETEEELWAVVTPFLHQGLERDEKVLYIVDTHIAEDILNHLRDDGLDVEPFLARGQLSILSRDETYIRDGPFDPDAMIALLRAETDQALVEGYSALRITGEMSWALRGLPGSERLLEYETRVNEVFRGSSCLAICQYDRRAFGAALLLDVLCTHPIAVVGTEVYDNFYYLSPSNLLGHEPAEARLHNWVQQLAEHKRAEDALRGAKDELESRAERGVQGAKHYRLTVRELTVLRLVAAGKSDRDIATVLGISLLTAHKHVANIRKKMGAASRTEAGVRAIKEGLLD
jgi:DNA-binding CsgD family transcriptional regulator